jgi:membrane dipeptidase
MYICDCHCDTLTKLCRDGIDFYENDLHLDIHRIISNGGGLQFCAIFVPTEEYTRRCGIRYTLTLLDTYKAELRKMQAQGIDIVPVLSGTDLDHVLDHDAATLLTIEEGGAIEGSLPVLRMYYELGVRAMTLVWSNRNDIADGVNEGCTHGGLTQFGREVVKEMNRLGMAVDVSHLSTYGFWDVLDTSSKPILASHSNALALCSHPRNLSDEQLRAINKNDGFVGINFAGQFLEEDWHDACIESVYRHISHMLDIMGNDDHVGFGSDFDGISHTPIDIPDVRGFVPLVEYLTQKFGEETTAKITHKNCLAYLKKVL